jgi:hypothetical protein
MPGSSEDEIAYFIAFVGILSCIAQVNNECLLIVHLMSIRICLDSSFGMFTKIFWCKRNYNG